VIKPSVMESYSQTAPYDCLKTEKIIRDTVEGILSKDEIGASATRADLLGLMATGEKKHIERVELLAELCIKDGLDALLGTVHSSSGKWGFKKKMLYAALPLYGGREALLPEFEEHKNLPGRGRDLKKWEALIQAAEEDKDPAKLISAGKAE